MCCSVLECVHAKGHVSVCTLFLTKGLARALGQLLPPHHWRPCHVSGYLQTLEHQPFAHGVQLAISTQEAVTAHSRHLPSSTAGPIPNHLGLGSPHMAVHAMGDWVNYSFSTFTNSA